MRSYAVAMACRRPARSIAVSVMGLALAMTACSPVHEATPEPGESEAIKTLARKLGYVPSWLERMASKVTGKPVEKADGIVLYDWLRRRQATNEGKLDAYQTPALTNPGQVEDTLAWERKAQEQDEQTLERIEAYFDIMKRMQDDCPAVVREEANWFDGYEQAHAWGKQTEEVNWDLRALHLVQPCQDEKNGVAAPVSGEEEDADADASAPASSSTDDKPFTAAEQDLIRRHQDAETNCKGSYDEQESEQGCRDRFVLLDELSAMGICWGKDEEFYPEYAYHRCAPGSIGYKP